MPVLEAIACGRPVIVTRGGPTDDFTNDEVAKYIPATAMNDKISKQNFLYPDDGTLLETMFSIMDDKSFREKAFRQGPDLVSKSFTWKHAAEMIYNVCRYVTVDVPGDMTRSFKSIYRW